MKLLLLDNYDSFTYNLAHLIAKVSDISFDVYKNDEISLRDVNAYDKIVLSPGPGLPSEAGIMPQLIKTFAASKSIFGVCLGMQAIGECFGASLLNLDRVYHGIATPITLLKTDPVFLNCPDTFMAGRYHSWVINDTALPPDLTVTAVDNNNMIMAVKHNIYDVRGVQFHPESILSEYGELILGNWLTSAG